MKVQAIVGMALALLAPVAGAQDRAALVAVDEVRIEPMTQTAPVLGRMVAREEGPVAAQVAGSVVEVLVDVGDRVDAGDIIARIDNQRLRIDRDLALAELEAATAEQLLNVARVQLLEQERGRMDRLVNSAAFSRANFDDKTNEIEVAHTGVVAAIAKRGMAAAQVELKQRNFIDATVRAPYPGVITVRNIAAGAYVGIGSPLVTVINDTDLEIEADVPAAQISSLEPGASIMTRPAGTDQVIDAVVRAVIPEENPLTRTRAVRLTPELDGIDITLAKGQSVTLDLPVGEARDVVSVDKDAVTQSRGQAIVYVVDDTGTANPVPVILGVAVGGRFEVIDGLVPGDIVVTRGNERLRPGQQVSYPGMPGDGEETPATQSPS